MKVILDTNVIIAAFAAQGLCHSVFMLCIDRCNVMISSKILGEVRENLSRKIKLPKEAIENIVDYLSSNFTVVEIDAVNIKICRDPDDNEILELAAKTQPDFIITGDDDLLCLENFGVTNIVKPREFWEIIRQAGI